MPRLPPGVVPVVPGPGQTSVWDHPRPPRLQADPREVVLSLGGVEVCRTRRGLMVLETSHPPGWYLPRDDWAEGALEPAPGTSYCEWKGVATYLTVVGGGVRAERAAWTYLDPLPDFAPLRGHVAVYPTVVAATVDGERVRPQDGGFYGGWVLDDVVGPIKGGPGSTFW